MARGTGMSPGSTVGEWQPLQGSWQRPCRGRDLKARESEVGSRGARRGEHEEGVAPWTVL
jgi:hypothetical protein